MNANEIRTGVYVTIKSIPCLVTGITMHGLVFFKRPDGAGSCCEVEKLKGIPLTETWLERCGFSDNEFETTYPVIKLRYHNGELLIWPDEGQIKLNHIKCVHDLQNIYFALTGEELYVNLPKKKKS